MDDNSDSFANAVALNGVSQPRPRASRRSSSRATRPPPTAFETVWFGGSAPAGFQIGTYTGSGVGLSTGGDEVNVFDAAGTHVTGVAFGASTTGQTFDNTAALGSATAPLPTISTLSVDGVNGAFTVGAETGSPGTRRCADAGDRSPRSRPWGSGDADLRRRLVGADQHQRRSAIDLDRLEDGRRLRTRSPARVALNGVREPGPGPVGDLRRGRRDQGRGLHHASGSARACPPASRSAPTAAPASGSAPAATRSTSSTPPATA